MNLVKLIKESEETFAVYLDLETGLDYQVSKEFSDSPEAYIYDMFNNEKAFQGESALALISHLEAEIAKKAHN